MEENNPLFENRSDLSELKEMVSLIRKEVNKVVVGQAELIDMIIAAILADGHVLLEGFPGVAKTLTAKVFSKLINAGFSRIQFTPDLMPSDVTGTSVFNLKNSDFEFKKGPIFSNIILIDEINRAPAKTQAALFEVMEERQVTVDGVTYKLEEPLMVIATQNPVEHEGTYRLPEAQLDRFLFKIVINYPELEDEIKMLSDYHQRKNNQVLDSIDTILDKTKIVSLRNIVKSIFVEQHLLQYIAEIVQKTRSHQAVYLGSSPRASIAILNSSKAIAAMNGRDFVTPDDIKYVAPAVIAHRMVLTPDKEMEGMTTLDVVNDIIEKIDIPR